MAQQELFGFPKPGIFFNCPSGSLASDDTSKTLENPKLATGLSTNGKGSLSCKKKNIPFAQGVNRIGLKTAGIGSSSPRLSAGQAVIET